VIGGPGSFVVPITDRKNFNDAIRTKLALEIAGRTPKGSAAASADKEPRVLCTIGEKLWQQRWGASAPAGANIPSNRNDALPDKKINKDDALLDKKMKSICRGC
jgi:hypothetical protein